MKYISFKGSNADIRLGSISTNNISNVEAKYKILEDLSVSQIVTVDKKRFHIKDYLLSLKEGLN